MLQLHMTSRCSDLGPLRRDRRQNNLNVSVKPVKKQISVTYYRCYLVDFTLKIVKRCYVV